MSARPPRPGDRLPRRRLDSCPMCGGAVRVVSADEGTNSYEPVLDASRVRGILERWRNTHSCDEAKGYRCALCEATDGEIAHLAEHRAEPKCAECGDLRVVPEDMGDGRVQERPCPRCRKESDKLCAICHRDTGGGICAEHVREAEPQGWQGPWPHLFGERRKKPGARA